VGKNSLTPSHPTIKKGGINSGKEREMGKVRSSFGKKKKRGGVGRGFLTTQLGKSNSKVEGKKKRGERTGGSCPRSGKKGEKGLQGLGEAVIGTWKVNGGGGGM